MKYDKEKITIGFKKIKGAIQERTYNVNQLLAYKLFYSKSASECLKIYNQIKKEGRFIQVITI
jgi:hypothetical protein